MADPVADNADFAVDELKRKARRRLVGAIVLALAAATILPLLLEQEQKPLGDDVSVQIPPVDGGKFVSRLKSDKGKDAAPEAKADAGVIRAAPDSAVAGPVPAPAPPAASPAPAPVPAPLPVAAGETDAKVAAPGAKATDAEAKPEPKGAVKPAPKAEVKSQAGAEAATRAKEAKPEPRAAVAAPTAAPASTTPPPSAANPALTTAATLSAQTPATSAASEAAAAAPPVSASGAESRKTDGYVVQLGAFTDNYGANALANKLKKAGYTAFTEPVETSRGTLWRVRVGTYPTRQAAVEERNKLKVDGYNGVVTAAK